MQTRRTLIPVVAAVLLAWTVGAAAALAGDEHDFTVVSAAGIYYGSGEHPRTPATILADEVWANIPEYRRIVDEGLSEDDPAYHLLLKKASERFARALQKAAKRDGHDMIGEAGSISVREGSGKTIPDITQALVDIVTRK